MAGGLLVRPLWLLHACLRHRRCLQSGEFCAAGHARAATTVGATYAGQRDVTSFHPCFRTTFGHFRMPMIFAAPLTVAISYAVFCLKKKRGQDTTCAAPLTRATS